MGTTDQRARPAGRPPARRLSIVVPVRDEAATIDELVARINAAVDPIDAGFELIVVDDASGADQLAAMRRAAVGPRPFRLIELARPAGQVAALVCGLAAAGGDVVVTMDGDLQDPPEEIPRLVAAVGPASIAVSHRRQPHTDPVRQAGSTAMTRLAGLLVGMRLADYGGQFNAYDRATVDRLVASWRPPTALLPLACRQCAAVVEVEVDHAPRSIGRSRYRPRQLVAIALDLVLDFAPRPALAAGATGAMVGAASLATRRGRSVPAGRVLLAAPLGLGMVLAGRAAQRAAGRRSPAYVVGADTGPVGSRDRA